jgi:hypothetical protein
VHRLLVLALDVAVVLVFAVLGRRSHEEGGGLAGVGDTAWPFLVGLLIAHLAMRGSASWRAGLVVWVCSVATGMVLRQLTGDGTAFSFVLVATGFLGAGLVGWRLLALVFRR